MLGYDLGGSHPLHPLRWQLTWELAERLGVLDGIDRFAPDPATDAQLATVHTPAYIAAVKAASGPVQPHVRRGAQPAIGHGLGTDDNPVFEHMHASAALIAGGSIAAARAIAARRGGPGGQHRRRPAPRDGRPSLRFLRLQRCRAGDQDTARRGRRQGRLRRRRRAPRRRRPGRVLRRPAGADHLDPRVAARHCGRAPAGRRRSGAGAAAGTAVNIPVPAGTGDAAVAAGLPRRRPRPGPGLPPRRAGHPARRRLARRRSAGRPEPVGRRPAGVLPGAARAGRIRPPTGAGWRSAAAGIRWSRWCRGPGPTCWPRSPDRDVDPSTALPHGLAGRSPPRPGRD